ITERIERAPAMPDAGELINGIEQRFDLLANMIERRQGESIEHGNALFHDLERRLDEMADRRDRQSGEAFDSAGIMEAIDARFTALAERLETRHSPGADQVAMRGLESRLEDISSRLDASAAQMAGIDPNLIRSLEAQVASLSAHLSKPDAPLPAFEDIGPRITRIEQAVAESRDTILEAAREAAENAVRALGTASPDPAAVAGLAQDLKTLEALTRRSDERNTKTFEAIHDTLLKIVDRLSMLESAQEEQHERREKVRNTLPETPSFAPAEDALSLAPDAHEMSAAEAALEGAIETVRAADKVVDTEPKRSMLSGLAKALSGRKAKQTAESEPVAATPSMPAAEVPEFSAPLLEAETALDPQIANEPLVPGSGAPDLNAIMKRVRSAKTAAPQAGDAEIAKADFIAAARRAAQAAAAETDPSKAGEDGKGEKKGTRSLFGKSRAPLLAGVAVVALTILGLQIGRTIVADDSEALQLNSGNAEEGAVALQGETATEENLVSEQSAVLEEPARPQPDPAGDMAWLDPTISNALPEVEEPPAPVEQVALPAEPSAE